MAHTIYLIPALGCGAEIFSRLRFPQGYTSCCVQWKEPFDNETLEGYTQRMFADIEFDSTDILLGVSFGALLAQRAAHPPIKKIILISGSQNPSEYPLLLRFARHTGLYKLILGSIFSSKKIKTFLVTGSLKKSYVTKFDHYFAPLSPYYYRWAIRQILESQTTHHTADVLRIHGENDKVFPVRRLRTDHVLISGAGHLMVYFNPDKISDAISEWLDF